MAYSTDSTDFLLFNHQQPKSSAVSTSAKKVTPLLRTASLRAIQTPKTANKKVLDSWEAPEKWHWWRIGESAVSHSQPPWQSASLWPCPQEQTPRWAPMWCSSANHVPSGFSSQQEGYHGKSSQPPVFGDDEKQRKTPLISYLRWWTSMTTSYFELFWWFLTGNQQFSIIFGWIWETLPHTATLFYGELFGVPSDSLT